jgi:chromosome partitioning protein
MVVITRTCSICSTDFELHFKYQMEECVEPDGAGGTHSRHTFFCSQRCLEASHRKRADGTVSCEACAKSFVVELASHVLFTGGRRHYACSRACRARIVEGARGVRFGQLYDPGFALSVAGGDADSGLLDPPSAQDAVELEQRRAPGPPRSTPRARTPHVIAVFNHKGGTGKTTTAVTLAAGLAAAGRRVLLVDADGQGNVAVSLGLRIERTLYHVIVMGMPVAEAVVFARPGLDVLASNEALAAAELYLAGRRQRDRVLWERLSGATQQYDFVLIDCSPSLSLLNQNALVASDAVLCPVACDYLSLVGVRQVLRTLKNVQRLLDHPVRLWGVLPTMFDVRARVCHEALQTLREHFGARCLEPVRLVSRVKEAPARGQTLFEYAPSSTAAADYAGVVARLLGRDEDASIHAPGTRAGGVG